MISTVYGDNALMIYTGKIGVRDESWSVWSMTEKVNEILANIEGYWHINTYQIATDLNIDQKTVLNHLNMAGSKNMRCLDNSWFDQKHLLHWVSICDFLLKRNETLSFFKQLITGNKIG